MRNPCVSHQVTPGGGRCRMQPCCWHGRTQYARSAIALVTAYQTIASTMTAAATIVAVGRLFGSRTPATRAAIAAASRIHCPMPPASIQWRVVAHGAHVSLPQLNLSVQSDIMPEASTEPDDRAQSKRDDDSQRTCDRKNPFRPDSSISANLSFHTFTIAHRSGHAELLAFTGRPLTLRLLGMPPPIGRRALGLGLQ